MKIAIVTPAPRGSRHGNRTTALRWRTLLGSLGHRVSVVESWHGQPADLLIALHALKSAGSMERFRGERPGRPLILALTGTDLYRELEHSARARRSLVLADRLVVLQPLALERLDLKARAKAQVIYQSVAARPRLRPARRGFEALVLAHLRAVKDPLLPARAARLVPRESRLAIIHLGAATSSVWAGRARAAERASPRYRWLGDLPRARALALLGRARLLIVPSRAEGGANVVSEAIACATPVLASRIEGNLGLLGESYPGYFEPADARGLARLLWRAESEAAFAAQLARAVRRLRPLVGPARERAAWRRTLAGLGV